MSVSKDNSSDGFLGRRGNEVTYLLNGRRVTRGIGISNKKPTAKQKKYRKRISMTNDLIAPAAEFINIGFKAEAVAAQRYPRDIMLSYTLLHAFKGEYPKQKIDYKKVLFSKGTMPETPGVTARMNGDILEFIWDGNLKNAAFRTNDQVMIMAYFPESQEAEYVLYAGNRVNGTAQFPLIRHEKAVKVETYISFISTDHKRVSNSSYTGQFVLPAYIMPESSYRIG